MPARRHCSLFVRHLGSSVASRPLRCYVSPIMGCGVQANAAFQASLVAKESFTSPNTRRRTLHTEGRAISWSDTRPLCYLEKYLSRSFQATEGASGQNKNKGIGAPQPRLKGPTSCNWIPRGGSSTTKCIHSNTLAHLNPYALLMSSHSSPCLSFECLIVTRSHSHLDGLLSQDGKTRLASTLLVES